MKKQHSDFIIDYDLAHSAYPNGEYSGGGVQKFHPAYLITNENLRQTIPMFGNLGGDILTVAASGDQPMYYAMHGAKRIDTFDMTFCARVMMDLKTTAVSVLSYVRYTRLIEDLYNAQRNHYDVMEIDDLRLVLQHMPNVSAEFIKRMSKCDIFCAGMERFFESPRLSRQEYTAFQQSVKQPFNFIWSDITELHTKLNMKYDIINISNIFDWIKSGQIEPTARNLFAYLKPGGILLATAFRPYSLSRTILSDIAVNSNQSAEFNRVFCTGQEVVLMLKRVR